MDPEIHTGSRDPQASNIGTEHFVGQAGAAAEGGVSVAMYEWSAGRGPIQGDQWTIYYPLVNKHRPWKSPIFNGN